MGTIFYPPGWDGPVAANGQVVGTGSPPSAAQPAASIPGPTSPPPPTVAPASVAAPSPVPAPPVTPAPPSVPAPAVIQAPIPPQPVAVAVAHRRPPRSGFRNGMTAVSSPRGTALAIVAGLLAVGLIGVAIDQNSTAKKWRKDERIEASRNVGLTNQLTSANASLSAMSTQVVSLQGHVRHLQDALQSAANQKEKALDQNVVLTRITAAAGAISDELSGCVDDMQSLIIEIGQDLATNSYDPSLGPNSEAAGAACSSAQSANAELQTEISSLG